MSTLERHPIDHPAHAADGSSSSVSAGASYENATEFCDVTLQQPSTVLAWVLADDERTRRLQSLITTAALTTIVPGLVLVALLVFVFGAWAGVNAAGMASASALVAAGIAGVTILRRRRNVDAAPSS